MARQAEAFPEHKEEHEFLPTVRFKLRMGYSFEMPGGQVVLGPKTLVLDVKTAAKHIHKADNTAEVRKACGLPPVKDYTTPAVAIPLDTAIARAERELARLKTQKAAGGK
jgi:hypothetical protein